VAYRHIAGLISEVSQKVAIQIAKKLQSSTIPLSFEGPAKRNPRKCACTLYFQKLDSLAYIFVADSMGISLFKFVQICACFLQQSVFWPFKVVQGHLRSMILVPIESAYTTSCQFVIVTMVLSCTVFEIQRLIG